MWLKRKFEKELKNGHNLFQPNQIRDQESKFLYFTDADIKTVIKAYFFKLLNNNSFNFPNMEFYFPYISSNSSFY